MSEFEKHIAKAELNLKSASERMRAADEAQVKAEHHLAEANELIDAASEGAGPAK